MESIFLPDCAACWFAPEGLLSRELSSDTRIETAMPGWFW
jgi:hypothetical protein